MKRTVKSKVSVLLAVLLSAALLCACGNSYEYTTGDVDWYSTYNKGDKIIHDTYYYSDDWFKDKAEKDNEELALASMQLTASAVSGDENGTGAAFLKSMGFDEVGFSDFTSADPDDFNYTWGKKTLDDGTVLVAVAVQSSSQDMAVKNKGWKQNFTVNGDSSIGEHYAYAKAVDKMIDGIADLGKGDKVKYWLTGHSRGGAIANVLAAHLPDKLGDRNAGIYAYTFEAPATVDEETAAAGGFKYIHNYLCSDDFVTMIPGWGMTRYGDPHELTDKKRDEELSDELKSLGSEAADHKMRIVVKSDADRLAANIAAAVPTRADYSKDRTDKVTASDGTVHEITYTYQDSMVKLMDFIFSGDGDSENPPLKKLMSSKDEVMDSASHLAEGLKLANAGKDPSAEYWTATEGIYKAMQENDAAGELTEEDLYKMLCLAAPVLIDFPEGSSEPSYDLLTDVAGYSGDLTYSHQFDTVIARLKLLAPAP